MKAGSLTDVVIHKTSYKRAYTPKSECKDFNKFSFDRTYFNILTNANYSYSQSQCFDVCLQSNIIRKCGCYDLKYLIQDNAKPCLNRTQIRCANLAYGEFIDGDIQQACESRCPLECESTELEIYQSSSSFPSSDYFNIIKNFEVVKNNYDQDVIKNLTIEDLQIAVLALNIYFNDLAYTQIEESEISDLVDLIANIGGTVGVFVGISILTFAEVLEFFLEVFITTYKLYFKKQLKKEDTYKV